MVVAADDGVMPQTREHAAVLRALGGPHGVVAVTKADWRTRPRRRGGRRLLPGVPVVPARRGPAPAWTRSSRRWTVSPAALPGPRDRGGAPVLHVDRAFTVRGAGTVVTGHAVVGRGRGAATCSSSGRRARARVRAVHVHDEPVGAGRARGSASRSTSPASGGGGRARRRGLRSGHGADAVASGIDAALRWRATPPARVHVHHGARDAPARLVPLGGDLWQARLEQPLLAARGRPRRRALARAAGHARRRRRARRAPAPPRAERRGLRAAGGAAPRAPPPADVEPPPAAAPAPRRRRSRRPRSRSSSGCAPPATSRRATPSSGRRRRARGAARGGRAVRVGRAMYAHPDALDDGPRRASRRSSPRRAAITMARLRDELGTSRKYAQALLEHLDAARVTLRLPDDRRVLRARTLDSRTVSAVPLTSLAHGAGCGCKLGPAELLPIVRALPVADDPDLLVGAATADDAAVYRLSDDSRSCRRSTSSRRSSTTPTTSGASRRRTRCRTSTRWAARPLTALNLVAFPLERLGPDVLERDPPRRRWTSCAAAGAAIVGGHSIDDRSRSTASRSPASSRPTRVLTNAGGRPGDVLVLTKPLGVGAIATAAKRGAGDASCWALRSTVMVALNAGAAEAARAAGAHALTDVTGFGLLGHLHSLARASGVAAEIDAAAVPAIAGRRGAAARRRRPCPAAAAATAPTPTASPSGTSGCPRGAAACCATRRRPAACSPPSPPGAAAVAAGPGRRPPGRRPARRDLRDAEERHWSGRGRCPSRSSKPVRRGSPTLGRFDSFATPVMPAASRSGRGSRGSLRGRRRAGRARARRRSPARRRSSARARCRPPATSASTSAARSRVPSQRRIRQRPSGSSSRTGSWRRLVSSGPRAACQRATGLASGRSPATATWRVGRGGELDLAGAERAPQLGGQRVRGRRRRAPRAAPRSPSDARPCASASRRPPRRGPGSSRCAVGAAARAARPRRPRAPAASPIPASSVARNHSRASRAGSIASSSGASARHSSVCRNARPASRSAYCSQMTRLPPASASSCSSTPGGWRSACSSAGLGVGEVAQAVRARRARRRRAARPARSARRGRRARARGWRAAAAARAPSASTAP